MTKTYGNVGMQGRSVCEINIIRYNPDGGREWAVPHFPVFPVTQGGPKPV